MSMLDALNSTVANATQKRADNAGTTGVRTIPVSQIETDPDQPRRDFHQDPLPADVEAAMQELANSIKASGLLQPILVRPIENDRFMVIAGERRFRAIRDFLKGESVEAIVRVDMKDTDLIVAQIVENLQRQELSDIDLGKAAKRIIAEHGLTQQQLEKMLGKSAGFLSRCIGMIGSPLAENGVVTKASVHAALNALPEEAKEHAVAKAKAENRQITHGDVGAAKSALKPAKVSKETAQPSSAIDEVFNIDVAGGGDDAYSYAPSNDVQDLGGEDEFVEDFVIPSSYDSDDGDSVTGEHSSDLMPSQIPVMQDVQIKLTNVAELMRLLEVLKGQQQSTLVGSVELAIPAAVAAHAITALGGTVPDDVFELSGSLNRALKKGY
jgi:ParB family chromosome partitioning protein